MLDRHSPIPLYHQLARILLNEVRDGTLAQGERIPSEHVLAERYAIGRPTVRQAVDSLARRGVLVRRRGSGTFVAAEPERLDLFSLAGTSAAFLGTGLTPQVRLARGPEPVSVPHDQDNPLAGQQAYSLCRVSSVRGEPVLVEDMLLSARAFPGLDRRDLSGASLARLAEEQYGLTLAGGEQRFAIAYPDERLAGLLGLPRSAPVLAVDRVLHFGSAPGALFARLTCRTDRFVFTQTIGGHFHV